MKKGTEKKMYRQGDILFVEVEALPQPQGGQPVPSGVVAEGEVTGHAHRVMGGEVTRFGEGASANLYVNARAGLRVTVVHEEHGPIELPTGVFKVVRQREYTPERIRTVGD